jgi:hypothetical protein
MTYPHIFGQKYQSIRNVLPMHAVMYKVTCNHIHGCSIRTYGNSLGNACGPLNRRGVGWITLLPCCIRQSCSCRTRLPIRTISSYCCIGVLYICCILVSYEPIWDISMYPCVTISHSATACNNYPVTSLPHLLIYLLKLCIIFCCPRIWGMFFFNH